MPEWQTACPDWERRIVAGESLIPFAPLYPSEAAAALDIFKALRIVDAPGSPTIGEACRPWLLDIAAAVFGSYEADTGRRLITEYFLCVSKKNWKSGAAASIMLTALLRNWRQSGEFLILSPTIEIANNSFGAARDMVRADEELSDLLHVQDHLRTITHRDKQATLKVVAADNETVGGKKGIGVLIDELWLFGKRPNAENMFREATGGQASRPEGFTIYLTTQSDEPPAGVFKQKLDYARGVRDGRIQDKQFLPIIYEHPAAMVASGEHRNPKNFYITNPNLGASVDVQFLERELRKADEEGEQSLVGFLAKHANVEVGLALRSNRWAGADFWQAAGDASLTLDALLERCEVAVIGIDGGGLDDLLGVVVLGRERETRRWLHWAHAWAHAIVLERRKAIEPQLRDFERQGDLTIVGMPGEDVAGVAAVVKRVAKSRLLPAKQAVGVDAAGIGAIVDELTLPGSGITLEHIIAISQGWKLNGAIKTAERAVAGGDLIHGAQPLMAWAVGNAKVVAVGNAITINKQVSGSAKIDPLMATFNAVSLMALNPAAQRKGLVLMTLG